MTDNPHEQSGMSVTIKVPESARYKADNPWFVFHGAPGAIKRNIEEAFGFDRNPDLTLVDVALNAQQVASGLSAATQSLGGRVISNRPAAEETKGEPAKAAEPEKNPLYARIEATASVDDLKTLWAQNRTDFDRDSELFAAWRARGIALKEGK